MGMSYIVLSPIQMEISSRWKNNMRQSIEAGVPGQLREQNTA